MMKKLTKQTKKNIGIITILYFTLILITIKEDFIYGSNVDWLKQHVTFADYFRNLFYETKQLLPNFAPHLGAGQNIFYFAYYGFLNPIILLSYFFPFIKMVDYIMLSSILLNLSAIYLFYYFIKRSKYSDQQALFATLLFVCSASVMFHFHRHIMFVNYLPFLLIGLIGTQKYIEEKKEVSLF